MTDECDLSEIEERLYSQIYHNTSEENPENQSMEQYTPIIKMHAKKRYFNTAINSGVNNISVRINVQNQLNEDSSQAYNFRKNKNALKTKKLRRAFNKQKLKNISGLCDYDNINLKEIKAQVDACPAFVKCLPPHIRKKLKKMNKRIAFIQKKKYLDSVTKFSCLNASVPVIRVKPRGQTKVITGSNTSAEKSFKTESLTDFKIVSELNDTVISISDDETEDLKSKSKPECKPNFMKILSSQNKPLANETINDRSALKTVDQMSNTNDFKRPDDDDVIFIEPTAVDVINLENDAESNCSTSTKSSTTNNKQPHLGTRRLLHIERKELLSTPESNNSNDFLENALPTDNVSWGFNFELHGTDFVPSKDSSKLNVKDVSGSESSCSVAACDLGGLLASNKCALFNEVDFDSPSKSIFEESNMVSFGDYITPNRLGSKMTRNVLQSTPVDEATGNFTKKKKSSEKLPNLSSIDPKESNDLVAPEPVENENLTLRAKKKKKSRKLVDVSTNDDDDDHGTESLCEIGKTKKKNAEIHNVEDAEDSTQSVSASSTNALPKLKKKLKKVQVDDQEATESECFKDDQFSISDPQIKRKRKNKKSHNDNDSEFESSIQNISETPKKADASLLVDELPKKRKGKKSINMENNRNSESNISLQTDDDKSVNTDSPIIITEREPKKRKHKKVINLGDTDDSEISLRSSSQFVEDTNLRDDNDLEKRRKKSKKSSIRADNDIEEPTCSNLPIVQDALVDIDVLTDDESKKKKHKSKKSRVHPLDIDHEEISENVESAIDNSIELGEATKKKKRKSKVLVSQIEDTDDTEVTNISETEIVKRKRRRDKSVTSDVSSITESIEYIDPQRSDILPVHSTIDTEPVAVDKERTIENDSMPVDIIAEPSTSSGLFKSNDVNLESSISDVVINDSINVSDSYISISDDSVSISDSDSTVSNMKYEGEDVQVANVMFRGRTQHFEDEAYLDIWNKMSDDASKWRILPEDRYPASKSPRSKLRCRKCHGFGHYANQCKIKPLSICCLCSGRGHLEPRCPYKLCTNCGRRSKFFTTFCSRCAYTRHILCRICKLKGHNQNVCPDLWRRYHLTVCGGPIVKPTVVNTVPSVKWCSGCGKQGHLEYQCQYFARDHCPTLPQVVDYKDHLFKARPTDAIVVSSDAIPPISVHQERARLSRSEPSAPPVNIAVEESSRQENINDSNEVVSGTSPIATCSFIEEKIPIIKPIIPVPQPIVSSTELDVMAKYESSTHMSRSYSPSPFLFVSPLPSSEHLSTFPFSIVLQTSYLHAKYLRICKNGSDTINKLYDYGVVDIEVHAHGEINIRCTLEDGCKAIKAVIFNHLQSVQQLIIPTEKLRIIIFLEEILLDLNKMSTITSLKDGFKELENDNGNTHMDKSIYFQRINMMIYGYFKWENGERYVERVKAILTTLKESENVDNNIRNELKQCLRYLIEYERPIRMYQDVIDNIAQGKTNFFNVLSLRIPEHQPSKKSLVITIDPMKYDFVKYSFPTRLMIFRWKTKLDVTLCDDKENLTLYLDGSVNDVDNAVIEYQAVVGEGAALPVSKWAIFDIVSSLLSRIQDLEFACYNLNTKTIRQVESSPELLNKNRIRLRKLHIHLVVIRGLKRGREKMLILEEFVNNYKTSNQNDDMSEHDRNQIQEAYNTIQFNANSVESDYTRLYSNATKSNIDNVILSVDEYNTLKQAKEDCPWHDKVNLLSPTTINSKYVSIPLVGTDDDRYKFKKFIFNYLDRAYLFDSNPKSLRLKLENALQMLWAQSFTSNKTKQILRILYEMESKKINSYHIEILRKLYQQLHLIFFGCCRLDMRTGAEIPSNNHVDTLRAYIAYLGTVNLVPIDIQMHIYETYTYIFGKEKLVGVNYKLLNQNAAQFYKKNKNLDENTIYICDSKLKTYITQSAYPVMPHSFLKENPLMPNQDVQNFVNHTFMIVGNQVSSINKNFPILIRSESYSLFSDSYRNISANLSISLQAITEIKSSITTRNVFDLLQHIYALEENSPKSELIDYKYQVMNIYLFGCCQLMDGLTHLNALKYWLTEFSQPDKADHIIYDRNLLHMLIASYEYIFWKGKKPGVHYKMLTNQTTIVSDNIVTTIPLMSIHIYDYFMHTRQGIDLIKECSKKMHVDIENNQENANGPVIKLTGESNALPSVISVLLNEIDQISIFKDIPFLIIPLRNYLNCKIEEVINAENNMFPLTILHDVEAITHQIDPSMSYTAYMQLCLRKELLCRQLNTFIFGVCSSSDDGPQHLVTLTKFVAELNKNPNIVIDKNQMRDIHNSLHYLFSQKLTVDDYKKHLELHANRKKKENLATRINLLPHVYDYLESTNGMSSSLSSKLQFKINSNTSTFPYVMVSGSNSYLSWIRNVFCEYNIILSKIPQGRGDLVIFLNKCLNKMQEENDPKSLWANIGTLEQTDSNGSNKTELNELYIKLHRNLFGYHRLGNGRALRQILNQHLINLKSVCDPSDLISMEIMQEIFFALQYIEGSNKQFTSQEYENFIKSSCGMSTTQNINNDSTETSQTIIKKEIELSIYDENEDTGYKICFNTELIPKLETTSTELLDQLNISVVPIDQTLATNQNNIKIINTNVQENESSGNIDTPMIVEHNLRNISQSREFPNIQIISNDCIQTHVKICKVFRSYLRYIKSGQSLLREIEELVQFQILPKKIVLMGTIDKINKVKKSITEHSNHGSFKLRRKIYLSMIQLRKPRHVHVFSMYSKALASKGKQRFKLFSTLHTHLFGVLQLCDGKYHMDILSKFLDSNELLIADKELKATMKSYEYVFGNYEKRIDYLSILHAATSDQGHSKGYA